MERMFHYYFAYGANMNIESMKWRCPKAIPIGKARLTEYKLNFRRGVATVEPQRGEYVPGALWKITTSCIKSLDHFEGYPRLYGRYTIKGGKGLPKVQIYIMQPGYEESPPSSYYLETILQGYKDFDWGKKAQGNLCKIARKLMEVEHCVRTTTV